MPRARRRRASISASGAEQCARTRTKRRSEKKDEKIAEIGGTVCSQEDNPPIQENPTSLQTTVKDSFPPLPLLLPPPLPLPLLLPSPLPLPLPEEPDYSKMCPKCSSYLKPAVVPEGSTSSLVQCPQCSTTPLCEKCLYPCPDGTCTNRSCQVVSLLLTCDRVTWPSRVYGCPVFRACPRCYNIIMHQQGCKYVTCTQCMHGYCFICLRTRQECAKDRNLYLSLTCSAPTATRQRFQT